MEEEKKLYLAVKPKMLIIYPVLELPLLLKEKLCIVLYCIVLGWVGLGWIELDWIELDWIELDWIGLSWIGLD